ncbi:hypothetical protein BC332_02137 [Capsicum chinense]|nr:hypothetical protein BC332_02137 [Capsicum chinense]
MATGPNMATITASLERSLQNCSLNNHRQGSTSNSAAGAALTDRFSDSLENHHAYNNNNNNNPSDDATLELNSEISLPYHWEQCLDLQTGEIYYINWRTGMKAKEDPRTNVGEHVYGNDNLYYSEEEEEDDNSYDSEGSSSEESAFSSSREPQLPIITNAIGKNAPLGPGPVLVVGGCKTCLMYFMVPKEVDDCPKCCGQLLHFDQN